MYLTILAGFILAWLAANWLAAVSARRRTAQTRAEGRPRGYGGGALPSNPATDGRGDSHFYTYGATRRIRTDDLLFTKQLLYH